MIFLSGFFTVAARAEFSIHKSDGWLTIEPATLKIVFQPETNSALELSAALPQSNIVSSLQTNAAGASWLLPDRQITVTLQWSAGTVSAHFLSARTGDFTFPNIRPGKGMQGWILPLFEGVYAPVQDAGWNNYLTNYGDLNTTADLGLPFIATDHGDSTVTYIFTNQFNNRFRFVSANGEMEASLTHEFTRNHPVKEYAVVIKTGAGSPIEPAKIYRQWLMERGGFVSLADKIKKTPEAAKLLGAIHAYIWGDGWLAVADVAHWKEFARDLSAGAEAKESSLTKRIWNLLSAEAKKAARELAEAQWADKYNESILVDDLNRLLLKPDFFEPASLPSLGLDKNGLESWKLLSANSSPAEIGRVNSVLLAAAFPQFFARPETWGNGVSPKMAQTLAEAGIDRAALFTADWDGLVDRPETVAAAQKAGYLIGTYDSYDSVHSPKAANTWETAQFDQRLYDTGAIVNADGSKRHGFQKQGYHLSPVAARPYVEKRIAGLMADFHANAWFMDCDGFGDFFDDYSLAHPATQQSDLAARISRLAWIRDTFGAVIGTEGCSAGVAATVHFAHGVMTPVIGWGDPELKDKQSKYYLGSYYPPDEPQVFFKPVPLPEKYRHLYFDPRFRLPLFEMVFHDSVVATHHWSFASYKTKDFYRTVELLELLYQVPPLYHLNLPEFKKRKLAIQHHYEFFSPLHRQTGLLALTGFKWLNPEHSVQETSFGDAVDFAANFSGDDFTWQNVSVPPGSIAVKWRNGDALKIYTP